METKTANRSKTKNVIKAVLSAAFLVGFSGVFLFSSTEKVTAEVPAEYKPNYKFSAQWEKIETIKSRIAGLRRNGNAVDVSLFASLLQNFNIVFQYLPQNRSEYRIVYESCTIGAQDLSNEYSITKFSQFQSNCLDPLDSIFNDIVQNYSVKAVIAANPQSGSAPLTVTFDGKSSTDASATIPTNGYFWYFSDVDGVEKVIGRGPIVTYTFTNPGKYLVHLTVRSVNEGAKGIFDDGEEMYITVGPQAANIFVVANGKKMNEEIPLKFTSQEAKDGIILDGSPTAPLGGRVIQKHEWTITDADGKAVLPARSTGGTPNYVKQIFTDNGLYNITLKTTDNEGNVVSKTFQLVIADPIAEIKISPEDGTTSSIYTFDASTSYSVQSTIRSYQWTITDSEGNEVIRERTKTLQHKFTTPGIYRVRLQIADQLGNTNEDSRTINVGSTPPVPQFTAEATKKRLYPSQYRLDASASYDVDTVRGGDSLIYEWSFSNTENVSIDENSDDNKRIRVSFKEKGTYDVTLTVRDNYGQLKQTSKPIQITSALRPEVTAIPLATKLGTDTTFRVKANKVIANYSWDFGDGTTRILQNPTIVHRYKRVGTYNVKLRVSTTDGETNDITTTVFVGEANEPIPVVTIGTSLGELLPLETCIDDNGVKVDAYEVDRYQNLSINANGSINVRGGTDNLLFYFMPQGGTRTRAIQTQYRFDELGCRFIDLTVEDTIVNKTASKRIRFVVKNATPKLQNILMNFPQAGSAYGIGIGQTSDQDLFKIDVDPLIVKLDAVGSMDTDGSISTYRWYYYNTNDPERLIEIKYTPANMPYVYFSMPRVPGEYRFAVEITDNDGLTMNSETFLGKGPVVFFPPSTTAPDIPMVTVKIDKVNAKVGEIVTIETIAKTISERADFAGQRTIAYDFDGDGTWDMTTKNSKVEYVYKNPGSYTPRVKVTYRGYSGIGNGERVSVEKGLKAGFLYGVVGNTLIARDASYGEITSRKFCADIRQCRTNENWLVENQTYFKKEYPQPGKYVVRYDIEDKNGNSHSAGNQVIDITGTQPEENSIGVVTLPAPGKDGMVAVGKNLDNKVLFYVDYNGGGECYIDTDISVDSENSGHPDQNRDIKDCSIATLYEYKNPSVESTIARVYFSQGETLATKDITVQFIDFNVSIPEAKRSIYTSINTTLASLPENQPELRSVLLQLRNAVLAGDNTSSLVLQLNDIFEVKRSELPPTLATNIESILAELSDKATVMALGGTPYESSKDGVLALIPADRRMEVGTLFEEIENANGNKEVIKKNLFSILDIGNEIYEDGGLDSYDMDMLQKEICNIVQYHQISGTSCFPAEEGSQVGQIEEPTRTGGGLGGVFKRILIIVGILGAVFVGLVVIFAIKAKQKADAGSDE